MRPLEWIYGTHAYRITRQTVESFRNVFNFFFFFFGEFPKAETNLFFRMA